MARNPILVAQKLAADMFRTAAKIVNGSGGGREIEGLLDIGADQIDATIRFLERPQNIPATSPEGLVRMLEAGVEALRAAAVYVGRAYENAESEEF